MSEKNSESYGSKSFSIVVQSKGVLMQELFLLNQTMMCGPN